MTGFKPSGSLPPHGGDHGHAGRRGAGLQRGGPQAHAGRGAGNDYLTRSRAAYNLTYATAKQAGGAPDLRPAGYPNANTLSKRLQTAAHLIGNLGTQIVTIHWGGFDTHTGQIASQDRQLKELSIALAAFQGDLKSRGIDQRVCTLVFSEFGRRVMETPGATAADAGTDHGAGGLMLAMGTGVKGGFAADWPGCIPSKLVPPSPPSNPNQGNLQVPTDFRSVYMSVLKDWLGGDDPREPDRRRARRPAAPRRRADRAVR